MKFKVDKNVTADVLTAFGFKTYNGKTFVYKQDLYKDLIVVRIHIYLDKLEYEYEVYDRYNQMLYNAFYNNINGKNNMVAEEVVRNFNDMVNEMEKSKIVRIIRGK